jgi:Domain of unknown function (DUF4124)
MRITTPLSLRPLLVGALLVAILVPAQAQWVWRDKDGRVTASDLPPPREVVEKDILQRPDQVQRKVVPPPAPAASVAAVQAPVAKPPVDPKLEAKRREASADDEKNSQQRAENCRRARGHLAALETGQRIARTNEKGEREILDDKGRAEEMRRANEVIASDCRQGG